MLGWTMAMNFKEGASYIIGGELRKVKFVTYDTPTCMLVHVEGRDRPFMLGPFMLYRKASPRNKK